MNLQSNVRQQLQKGQIMWAQIAREAVKKKQKNKVQSNSHAEGKIMRTFCTQINGNNKKREHGSQVETNQQGYDSSLWYLTKTDLSSCYSCSVVCVFFVLFSPVSLPRYLPPPSSSPLQHCSRNSTELFYLISVSHD